MNVLICSICLRMSSISDSRLRSYSNSLRISSISESRLHASVRNSSTSILRLVELGPSPIPYHVQRVSRLPLQQMRPDRSFPITETKASSVEMGVLPLSLYSEGVNS
ncbi:hypothetical protein Taro_049187 [Colocasia esculenta]|uniref:Uncharacterized protein n=1 Tax=Colocasia esculenta TaxID=4460 RepID=A0A843XA96_COLES|nr:hypothetical protein [Colocasia esculenta]